MANIDITGELKFPKERITQEIVELIHRRLEYIHSERQKLEKDINSFQAKFRMSNDEFVRKFADGKIDDKEEFFIWDSSLKILAEITEEEQMLKELI